MSGADVLLVLTNLPDRDSAQRVAQALIENRAAACVNMLTECASVYRWQGKVETASEVPLLIKTTRAAYKRLEETICAHHPYELPEIIAVPVGAGLPGYLQWVAQETQIPNGHGKCAAHDETRHVRFPHPSPLDETTSHSTKPPKTAAKSLVNPEGEGDKDSLCEFHVKNESN